MSSAKPLRNLPLKKAVETLRAPNAARVQLPVNVKGIDIFYRPGSIGRTRFMTRQLGLLVHENPNVSWASFPVRQYTKALDPSLQEAAAKMKDQVETIDGKAVSQKIVIKFADGTSKTVPIGRKTSDAMFEAFLGAAGVSNSAASPTEPTVKVAKEEVPAEETADSAALEAGQVDAALKKD